MLPILYKTITEGTVPTNYGAGVLSDAISCTVTEERNGAFELALEYPATGIHAEEIEVNNFIKAKPNFTDDPQIFRIYKVGKVMAGKFLVSACHISYDLSGKLLTNGSAGSCVAACALLEASAGNFTINTDKTLSGAFRASQPASVRSWFGGKEGSILDVYGPGEWKYDNYTASFKAARGQNRGVTIRYGKNLTQLSQEINMSNLATAVLPYYVDQNGAVTTGTKTPTGLTLDVEREIAVDFSSQVDPDSATPISTQLDTLATKYIANNNLTTLTNSITLDFVQLEGIAERVDLCDTVNIYFEALGITAQAKCVATTWDVLADRYTKTTFGDARTNIADTISNNARQLEQTPTTSFMAQAITRATELITGNLGGYVILNDTDNNGEPDEILIMNTPDISTATKVWRWNASGLGYSSTGYAGPYGLAMTSDGEIVADYITTGTLNANLIKAGVISDVQGNSTIDMANGEAKMKNFKAISSLDLIDTSKKVRGSIKYNSIDGSSFEVLDGSGNRLAIMQQSANGGAFFTENNSGTVVGTMQAQANGGAVSISKNDGTNLGRIDSTIYGGNLSIKNNSGAVVGYMQANSAAGASLGLLDSSETINILCSGDSGNVRCVSLTQTSSRKVKENIAPIEDAEKILELEAVRFDYKNKATGTDKRGFIAEDVAEILPNLVAPEAEGRPASLDYIGMIPYLQAVLKAQAEEIKELKAKIKNMEG